MSAEATIKAQARETLKNNYLSAICALLTVLLPFMIIDGATTFLSCLFSEIISEDALRAALIYGIGYPVEIVGFFLFSPVINGYIRAFYKASYTKIIDVKDVFYYFNAGKYKNALALNLSFILRMLIPAILFYLPLIVYVVLSNQLGGSYTESLMHTDCYFLLAVMSTAVTGLYALRYLPAYTVTADFDDLTVKQAFEYSRYIMRNRTGSAAKLVLSFAPWMLLCITVLPALYVIPYMTQSVCISAKWMTKATFEVN